MKTLKLVVCVLAVLGAWSVAVAQPPAPVRILFFGNSLTSYGVDGAVINLANAA